MKYKQSVLESCCFSGGQPDKVREGQTSYRRDKEDYGWEPEMSQQQRDYWFLKNELFPQTLCLMQVAYEKLQRQFQVFQSRNLFFAQVVI